MMRDGEDARGRARKRVKRNILAARLNKSHKGKQEREEQGEDEEEEVWRGG